MADSPIPAYVVALRGTQSRLDATVILGATRVQVTLNTTDEETNSVLRPLLDHIVQTAKSDMVEQLDGHITATAKQALRA